MRKLIELSQENLIECDNCDFVIINTTKDANIDGSEYINVACPKCGENLLTESDYQQSERVLKIINWLNRWFSWLTFFSFSKKEVKSSLKIHNGINFKKYYN